MADFAENTSMRLDALDRRLLRAVQEDARQTYAGLARLCHSSPSSVRRRLEALRRSGAIRREIAVVDPSVYNPGVRVLVMVAFARESAEVYRSFQARMANEAPVAQCHSIAGEFDFALVVRAPDPTAYDAWARRVLLADTNIRRYSSFVIWSTVKEEWQPLVPLDAE